MRSLIYISRKVPTGLDARPTLNDIIRVSQTRNALRGITGALASTIDYYVQILEGTTDVVAELMETVEDDWRHTDVLIVQDTLVAERSLPDWAMAYCGDSVYITRQIDAILLAPEPGSVSRISRLRSLLVTLGSADGNKTALPS